jgi:hypothetical protein
LEGKFDDAAAKLSLSIQDDHGFPTSYRALAECYAHMGRLDEARATVARLRAITQQSMPSDLAFRNPEHRELFLSGCAWRPASQNEPRPSLPWFHCISSSATSTAARQPGASGSSSP